MIIQYFSILIKQQLHIKYKVNINKQLILSLEGIISQISASAASSFYSLYFLPPSSPYSHWLELFWAFPGPSC